MNRTRTSYLNPTPVIAFNRFGYTTFRIEYRYVETLPTAAPATTTTRKTTLATTTTRTITTTTKAPVTTGNCIDINTSTCANNAAAGYCNMFSYYSFQNIKYNCGKTCGMCGQAASPCVDIHEKCDLNFCVYYGPRYAEYQCAKTCGFCQRPN